MVQIMRVKESTGIKRRHRNKKDLIFYWSLIILPIIQILIFYIGVNFQTITMAFQRYDTFTDTFIWDFSTNLTKFKADVSTAGFWAILKNSLFVYLFTTLTGTGLAILFAYYIHKKHWGNNFFRFMLFLPSVVPAILLTIMYKDSVGLGLPAWMDFLFGVKMANPFASSAGGTRYVLITLFTIWVSFGGQVLIYSATMDRIDPSIVEAGLIDGTTPWQEFRYLVLPNIAAAVSVFIVTGLASFFSNQNNIYNFLSWGAMPQEKTMGYFLYTLVANSGKTGYCYSAFLGLICTVILVPVVTVVRNWIDKE